MRDGVFAEIAVNCVEKKLVQIIEVGTETVSFEAPENLIAFREISQAYATSLSAWFRSRLRLRNWPMYGRSHLTTASA